MTSAPARASVWHDARAIVLRLLGESKRVAVVVFVVSAFLIAAVVLQERGAPESVVLACVTSAGTCTTVSLPFLLRGVTQTDLAESTRMGSSPGAGAAERPVADPALTPGGTPPSGGAS